MCGLVGAAGTLEHFDNDVMDKLLLFDYFRGKDATGLATVSRHTGDVKLFKRAVDPLTAFDMTAYKDVRKAATSGVMIGHNRAATRGNGKSHANAHPFEHKHIVGAHNGTLSTKSFWDLKKLIDRDDIEVDSEALFIAIAEYGIEEVVPLLQGAWALTWYDAKEEKLKWLRNDQRPFWYGYSKDLKKVYWASEWGIIDAAMGIGNGSVWPKLGDLELYADKEGMSFWATKTNTLYEWDMKAVCKDGFGKVAAKTKTLKGKEPDPVGGTTTYGEYDPFGRQNTCGNTGGSSTKKETGSETQTGQQTTTSHGTTTTTTTKTKENGGKTTTSTTGSTTLVSLIGNDNDPLAGVMTKEEFDVLTCNGCSWCGETVEYGDPGVTIFEKDRTILCSDCCNCSDGEHARILVENIEQFL